MAKRKNAAKKEQKRKIAEAAAQKAYEAEQRAATREERIYAEKHRPLREQWREVPSRTKGLWLFLLAILVAVGIGLYISWTWQFLPDDQVPAVYAEYRATHDAPGQYDVEIKKN